MVQGNNNKGPGLSFFGMVGIVMAALKLKERWDDYRQVPGGEGRVALSTTSYSADGRPIDPEVATLLDTEIPMARPKRRRQGCCVCCGMNCSLFWKAFGIVLGALLVWNAFKLLRWAITPSPSGLEGMPAFSTSLGCLSAPYMYNDSAITYAINVGAEHAEHSVGIRGGAVGTLTIAKGDPSAMQVVYEMTLSSEDQSLLKQVSIGRHGGDSEDTSRTLILTPIPDSASTACSRFDVTLFVPPNLKQLHVASHARTHIRFDPNDDIHLDDLQVTLYSDENNQILPHANLHASSISLEVFRGWIVGEVSVGSKATVTTQRGDGVTNIHFKPVPIISESDVEIPAAEIQTITGAGRTDVFFEQSWAHRSIKANHVSSTNGDLYLTYRDANFNGLVKLDSKSYSARGISRLNVSDTDNDASEWTHFVGDKNGADKLVVSSRGWTGLYF